MQPGTMWHNLAAVHRKLGSLQEMGAALERKLELTRSPVTEPHSEHSYDDAAVQIPRLHRPADYAFAMCLPRVN